MSDYSSFTEDYSGSSYKLKLLIKDLKEIEQKKEENKQKGTMLAVGGADRYVKAKMQRKSDELTRLYNEKTPDGTISKYEKALESPQFDWSDPYGSIKERLQYEMDYFTKPAEELVTERQEYIDYMDEYNTSKRNAKQVELESRFKSNKDPKYQINNTNDNIDDFISDTELMVEPSKTTTSKPSVLGKKVKRTAIVDGKEYPVTSPTIEEFDKMHSWDKHVLMNDLDPKLMGENRPADWGDRMLMDLDDAREAKKLFPNLPKEKALEQYYNYADIGDDLIASSGDVVGGGMLADTGQQIAGSSIANVSPGTTANMGSAVTGNVADDVGGAAAQQAAQQAGKSASALQVGGQIVGGLGTAYGAYNLSKNWNQMSDVDKGLGLITTGLSTASLIPGPHQAITAPLAIGFSLLDSIWD